MLGGSFRARSLHMLTRARIAAGRLEDAERSATIAEACAEGVGLPVADAMAGLARAEVELARGDAAAAGRRALEAAATLENAGDVYDAARARVVAGRALSAAGETAAGVAELERAANAFAEFGAERYRAQAERELQLARLVVERKTNPQIAAELFLSQKTVETHLRNIFRKVGVSSRVELARAVEHADHAASGDG